MSRSFITVEDRRTALREAGDLVLAIADGAVDEQCIHADLRQLVLGIGIDMNRPRVFKSVGMAWQDAVVAEAILARSADVLAPQGESLRLTRSSGSPDDDPEIGST